MYPSASRILKNLLLTTALVGVVTLSSVASAEDIAVTRVILSTSGLANFKLETQVTGNTTLEFPVRLNQVDDILKSLVVFDKKGRLGGVTLPGKQPLNQVFKDVPFSKNQLSNPISLLNVYQGAVVSVKTAAGGVLTGKLLSVESFSVMQDDKKLETKNRISLMTDSGIRQTVLEDAQSLSFDDPRIKGEIQRALDAIRENGTADRRTLSVNLLGDGKRDVTLSYVVDAPLWKTAYRMVVPETGEQKGLLQGWAVVENMTAADWKNVDLTLVSGNPVTFKQSLYQSYYVDRPEIPVEVFGRVMPRTDKGTVATAAQMERKVAEADTGRMKAMAAPAPAAAPMMAMDSAVAGFAGMTGGMLAPESAVNSMEGVAQVANAAQSAEATTQVLFRFPDRFNLKAGQTMMLPFVSHDVPMEKVSIYQPETHPSHPLAAVELTNEGDTGLPPGVLTLYEESGLLNGTAFVGDAQMPTLSPGEKRIVSYALDSKTTISRDDKSISSEGKITVSGGVLKTQFKNRSETVYTVKAPAKEDRVVIIEHPKMFDYKLETPDPKTVDVSDNHYRLRVALKAGETKTLPVVLENVAWQSWSIDGLSTDQLAAYASSQGDLTPETRKQFAALAELRREMDGIDAKVAEVDRQREMIFSDQARVRENLKSLDGKSDVQKKYLDKLNEQENQIDRLDQEKNRLAGERAQAEKKLKEEIADISF